MKNNDMIKYLAGGIFAIAFIGVVVWLVQSEGQRTRESIREAAKNAGSEFGEGIVEGAATAVEKAADVPGKVIRDVKDELSYEVTDAAERAADKLGDLAGTVLGNRNEKQPDKSTAAPVEQPPAASSTPRDPPATTTSGTAAPEPTSAGSHAAETPERVLAPPNAGRPQSDSTPEPKKDKDSTDLSKTVGRLFDLGHEVAKSVDDIGQKVFALSEKEERRVGADVHKLVLKQHKRLRAPEQVKRLQALARPLLLNRKRKEIKYTVTILDDETVNAFAHVGGYIYVNKGLLQLVTDNAELQFILSHEIGHVDLKHCTRAVTYAARASDVGGELGGSLALLAYTAIALGYSEGQEFEADEYGCRAIQRAGQNGQAAVTCLQQLAKHFDKEPSVVRTYELPTAVKRTIEEIEEHFRSHPSAQERIKRLEPLLRQPATR